jgi:hypothetical protein
VAQIRVENSSLLRRLADVNQKFNAAAVDNRVLKADVETLRAKVCFCVLLHLGLFQMLAMGKLFVLFLERQYTASFYLGKHDLWRFMTTLNVGLHYVCR